MYRTSNIVPDLKSVSHKGVAYFPEPLLYYHKNTLHSPPHSHLLDPEFSRQPIIASFGLQHFFVLWDISVLTIHSADLKTVTKIPCENKYGLGMTVTKKGLLLCGVNEVQFVRLSVGDKGRWGKEFSISGRSKAQAISYIKGYWLYGENLLLNSLQQLFVYNLQTMELLSRYNGVVRKEFPMTKAIFNQHYSYFILGLNVGQILVHKPSKKEPLHVFKAHRTAIQALNSDSDSRRFWSVSSESLRLWNLDTFTMAFQHQFQISYSSLKFYGTLLYNQRPLALVNLQSPDQLIADVASEVLSVQSTHSPPTIQITLNNNLGVQVSRDFLAGQDIHKNSTRTFYPPLKSKGILQIASVPGQKNRFLMLIENGEICWTRLGEQSSTIQNIIDVQKISDEEGKLLLQKASFILLPRSPLPKIDPQIIGTLHFEEQGSSARSLENPATQLIIGCSKGAIIAVDFMNPKKLFTRLTYHREAVIDLKEIQLISSKQTLLISLCLQNNFRLIRTSTVQTVAVISINTGGTLKLMETVAGRLFCVIKEALQIFTLTQTFQLEGFQNYQHPEHQGNILSVSVNQQRQLVATAAQDNLLKIRNFYKILLFQIVFSPNLNHAFFLGKELDLIVANDCKLFLCRSRRITIDSDQEEEASMAFVTSNPRLITLQRIFRNEKTVSSESLRGFKTVAPLETKVRLPSISESSPKKKKTLSVVDSKQKGKQKQRVRQRDHEREKEKPLKNVIKALEKLRGQAKGVYRKELQMLRKVGLKKQDHVKKESIMDKFMRQKVLEKKVLTRREVTTNRIIMKNIIKDYMHEDHDSFIL